MGYRPNRFIPFDEHGSLLSQGHDDAPDAILLGDRARMLGGNLDVASAVPKGTVVRLDIPWSDER